MDFCRAHLCRLRSGCIQRQCGKPCFRTLHIYQLCLVFLMYHSILFHVRFDYFADSLDAFRNLFFGHAGVVHAQRVLVAAVREEAYL